MAKLMNVSCDPDCGFSLSSHNKSELFDFTKKHASSQHKLDMSDREVEERMTYI